MVSFQPCLPARYKRKPPSSRLSSTDMLPNSSRLSGTSEIPSDTRRSTCHDPISAPRYWTEIGSWQVERSEEHTSELQSLMRISYAVFCLKKKNTHKYIAVMTDIRHIDTFKQQS